MTDDELADLIEELGPPPPCICDGPKDTDGLCEQCAEGWRIDPVAYLDYGDHPAGIQRYRELLAEINADAAAHGAGTPPVPCDDSDIP